jgi:hypothetical protein
MESGIVSSGDFIEHNVEDGGNRDCNVNGMLVHTFPGQDKPVVILAHGYTAELRKYDPTSWQCVSQCTTPAGTDTSELKTSELEIPCCLYQSDGEAYVHCEDGSLHRIVSVDTLTISTSPHGHVTGDSYYECISHLCPGRLVAVSGYPPVVHVMDLHGRQLTDLTICGGYSFTEPCGVVCDGRRVVVTGRGEGSCLGREWDDRERVVCVEESAGAWSVQWMHDVDGYFSTSPIIAPGVGTVIVPYQGSPGRIQRIVSLSLETGAVVQQVDVSPGCLDLGCGTCIYGGSLLISCEETDVVVEFSLVGKMVCHHTSSNIQSSYIAIARYF